MATALDFGYKRGSSQSGSTNVSGFLRLKIFSCPGLSKKENYYVKIILQTAKKGKQVGNPILTQTTNPTTDPIWNEMFIVEVDPVEHNLLCQVFVKGRLTDTFVGKAEIPLGIIRASIPMVIIMNQN